MSSLEDMETAPFGEQIAFLVGATPTQCRMRVLEVLAQVARPILANLDPSQCSARHFLSRII